MDRLQHLEHCDLTYDASVDVTDARCAKVKGIA
jgi:hypothetical protein